MGGHDGIRARFERSAAHGADDPRALARAARAGEPDAACGLAALLAHAAFAAPEQTAAIYDAAAEGWLDETGRDRKAAASSPRDLTIAAHGVAPMPIPASLWPAFWAIVDDAGPGVGAGEVTTRTAALGAHLAPDFAARAARACAAYDSVLQAAGAGIPPKFSRAELAACPPGSLGADFHRLIVDNGFDLEVLDRDALGLDALPAPLDYLNARILQCHDLWHLTAGYRTTKLHEVAISAFQLAQFGHGYSAMFLAVATSGAALARPDGAALLFHVILTAWRHGRATPALIGVAWEKIWNAPLEEVRAKLGVTAYVSPVPADLFEQAAMTAPNRAATGGAATGGAATGGAATGPAPGAV